MRGYLASYSPGLVCCEIHAATDSNITRTSLTEDGRVAPATRMTIIANKLRIQRAAFKEYNCCLARPAAAGKELKDYLFTAKPIAHK